MTAEIVIMNRSGIVMAADSVVTSRTPLGGKTYPTANKLFAITYDQSIGIMTYGSAEFIFTPWENLIKVYRHDVEKRKEVFKTVEDCCTDFINYLQTSNLFTIDEQKKWTLNVFSQYHSSISFQIKSHIQEYLSQKDNKKSDNDLEIVVRNVFKNIINETKKSLSCNYINDEYIQSIKTETNEIIKEIYEMLSESYFEEINELTNLFFKLNPGSLSGIVISGFGEQEIKPYLISLNIIDMRNNHLIYNKKETNQGGMYPFAQTEVVKLFMRDINPYCQIKINKIIKDAVPNNSDQIIKEIEKYIDENSQPKGIILDSLPLPDLASAAENLVSLTSFHRRFSADLETVGGPIDVAAISKGDGFIWIKRKHYFDPDLNQHFVGKYYYK